MKIRISLLFLTFCFVWISLLVRTSYLQIFPNEKLSKLMDKQSQTAITLNNRRGKIYDRNTKELAASITSYSLYADPSLIKEQNELSRSLSKVLKIKASSISKKIKNTKKKFVWIQRRLPQAKMEKIKELKLKGIGFVKEAKRIYPNEKLLSQVLGFVGSQGRGLEGLEAKFDEYLSGKKIKLKLQKDARGRPLLINGKVFTESPDGYDLHLTVDLDLQYQLEKELLKAVEDFSAESAVGVVLEAQSSRVLAMANIPNFDPNYPLRTAAQFRRNRSVTDPFEPGSTLKTFTLAAALKEGKYQPNSRIFCENGKFKIGRRTISEADSKHKFKWLTLSEVLAKSSNIGTSKIAIGLGAASIKSHFLDFGFYQKLSTDLIGESRGLLPKLPWKKHLLANISFGHGIATTPLQIANAYASIANGGVLKKPYIVESITDGTNRVIEAYGPKSIRRVVSKEVANKLRILLSQVTLPGGTGRNAQVSGYPVAGKTGTAQKVKTNGRGYEPGAYISSFAGFVPANSPKYVIYIAVDKPEKAFYGSEVAAPVFSRLAKYALLKDSSAPVMVNKKNILAINTDTKVIQIKKNAIEKLESNVKVKQWQRMPKLTGLDLRELIKRVKGQRLDIQVLGKGYVFATEPKEGESLLHRKAIKVHFKKAME